MTRRRANLIGVWLLAAAALGLALAAARRDPPPHNDPDLAYQRPGFLDARATPFPAPAVIGGMPTVGARTVVFFTQPDHAPRLGTALAQADSLRRQATVLVVVSGEPPPGALDGLPVLRDDEGRIAAAYAIRRPRDGGPPIGYAIIDSNGQVRYRTLDPNAADLLSEVETMVKATP